MPFKPKNYGDVATLGWLAIEWMHTYLVQPDSIDQKPFRLTREQAKWLLDYYAIHPVTGRFLVIRGIISRPRGWGKSPLLAAMGLFEALGPAVFAGWDAQGQPTGMPWAERSRPIVHLAGTAIEQTANTWNPLLDMCNNDMLLDEYTLDIAEKTRVITLPDLNRGVIAAITSSARTTKGARPVFVVMDQTEEWVTSNGGPILARTLRANAAKVGGRTVESPNAFIPGENSVAEESWKAHEAIKNGTANKGGGVLFDHREAPADTNLRDRASLIAGIKVAYGDSADSAGGWVDVERQAQEFLDISADVQQLRRDKLNQITNASNAWYTKQQVELITDTERAFELKDTIVLGFDGSRGVTSLDESGKRRGGKKADATSLIGMRVRDGHTVVLGHWEAPDGPDGDGWVPDEDEMLEAVEKAHSDYNVIGFFADPNAGWWGHVGTWSKKYGKKYKVKVTAEHPIAWDVGAHGKVVKAFEALEDAILNRDITFNGDADLKRHLLNARRKKMQSGYSLTKPENDFTAKVDAVYSLMLANQARLTALKKGANEPPKKLWNSRPRSF